MAKRVLEACLDYSDETLAETVQAALERVKFDEDPLGLDFDTVNKDEEWLP